MRSTDHKAVRSSAPRGLLVAAGVLASAAGLAPAGIITDPGFFNDIPTTNLGFETDGAGAPVNLIDGERRSMPFDEYKAFGITFNANIFWVNDGSAAFDLAQMIGGSPSNSIPSSVVSEFTILYNQPTLAMGFFIVNNRSLDPAGPIFTARDSQGNILESCQFTSIFHDGSITAAGTVVDYGFMGLYADVPIASVTVTKQAAIFDDFRYSPVPTPGSLALLSCGALLVSRRKR